MKNRPLKSLHQNPIMRPALLLLAITSWLMTGEVSGQILFSNLHSFTPLLNADGNQPNGGLTLSDGTLYGTTATGGTTNGGGTVFAVSTNGTGYTVLYNFSPGQIVYITTNTDGLGSSAVFTNFTGSNPNGDLVLFGGVLYGTTQGYPQDSGAVFAINTDGTGFTNIYTFSSTSNGGGGGIGIGGGGILGGGVAGNNPDGANPRAGLILAGSTLYGTTAGGGVNGSGTVFKINLDGTGFTSLMSFDPVTINPGSIASLPNATGAQPAIRLVLVGGNLYGTTSKGGAYGYGAAFVISTNGTGFADLHDFTALSPGALTWSGSLLYGVTYSGGLANDGMVFALSLDGKVFSTVASFDLASTGAGPSGGLFFSDGYLFGVTQTNLLKSGEVFAVNTNGTGLTVLYSFTTNSAQSLELPSIYTTNSDGSGPGGVFLSGNVLYGTASSGGTGGGGTVFSLDLGTFRSHTIVYHPPLAITTLAGGVMLTWPTNDPAFLLQATTNPADASSWSPVTPAPVVVGDQFTITIPPSGQQQFFRLAR